MPRTVFDRFPASLVINLSMVIRLDIYLDVLVILNTYLTWLLLTMTAAVTHTALKTRRLAIASFLGGLSALIILIPTYDKLFAFTALALKIVSCAVIVITAFWRQSHKKLLLLGVSFLGITMLTSAALALLQNTVGTSLFCLQSGFIYLDISPVNLVISTAIIYFLITVFSKLFAKNLGALNAYRIDFQIGCKAFSLDAIADTGNTARDLFSGLPVIICTGVEIESGRNLRAVPYKTISGEGILYAFSPDALSITDEKGSRREISALVAGIDPGGEQKAIFNPKILIG